jgi:glycosyltransferase involved in cell wall biosynthesis
VFQPHDLQHIHLPEFFSRGTRARRIATYDALARQAAYVVVGTRQIARDVERHLNLPSAKVKVVNLAPLERGTASADVLGPYELPEAFVYYPAATWPHKNHVTILRAAARLRNEGLRVPVVSTGQLTEHLPALRQTIDELGLGGDVHFLGFVPDEVVGALHRRALAVVVPTLFEAASFPIWEAFQAGTPVISSTVTSLPDQVGDAALLVDPLDIEGWANAIRRLWTDRTLSQLLTARAAERVSRVSWSEAARRMLAIYRMAAGTAGHDDHVILERPTLI